jgi:DMSO/TMAO reductase YedYZ molybdopterin-dependent catalytic subunit
VSKSAHPPSIAGPGGGVDSDPLSSGPTPGSPRRAQRTVGLGIVIGLVAAGVAIGVAQLAAGIVNPQASPIITVGQSAIDASPEWLKSFAIRTFGENDKLVLLAGIGAVLALISAALGIASVRRAWVGIAGLVAFGAIGVAAAVARPTGRLVDAVPTIVGAIVAGITLFTLRRILFPSRASSISPASSSPDAGATIDRRRFLFAGALGAVAAAIAGGAGNLLARRFQADASRAAVRIPAPASSAATRSGAGLSVPGLGPFYTPNNRFYRVDTALLVPAVMAEEWQLRVHGMVDREITLGYEQLLARPLIERDVTLACVSNPVGGRYVGNARWIGAPLKDLLEEVGVRPGADQMVTRSVDGFTIGTPTAVAMDGRDSMLAVAMNGEPLPLSHGFPVRMIVPGLYGYVSATKWLVDIELSSFDAFDAYWVRRGWAERAPVKTMSRIDTPVPFVDVTAGEVPVAGVAWAQHRGIERVELQVDEGPWLEAELAREDSIDTWRQWVYRWAATPGTHTLRVRATDGTGVTQTAARARPFPDGATGHHSVAVQVT